MLPLQQAYEVKHSILEYLKATFSFKDRELHEAFDTFLTDKEEGIFKGPYISLKLPFAQGETNQEIPLEIKPNFPPYEHQLKSFARLTTEGAVSPKPTLITTGTSSGKTECFLFPILDYCKKNEDRRGIKVIILYPMNALATDQANRFAETIWKDERLKGKITVGLFIGEGKDKTDFPSGMGEKNVIENRDSIVDSPPDILLTNFKMLDYALMQSRYHNIWNFNLEDPALLQFLVLDELHTYDGAQGTDVANLIRRLKLKLNISKGSICPIGTSATIGTGPSSLQQLTEYASKVFGEVFDSSSVITETRMQISEFIAADAESLDPYIPRQIGLLESRLQKDETYPNYISRQKQLWQLPSTLDVVSLGDELKKLRIVRDLLSLTTKKIINIQQLLSELADLNVDFRRLPEWDTQSEMSPREEVIHSLLALMGEAKTGGDIKFPFLYLQIQLWIRELRGVLRMCTEKPEFSWKEKVGGLNERGALPAYFCRECGASGWLGVKDDNSNSLNEDNKRVYDYFFNNHKNIYFINTESHRHIEEYQPDNVINAWLNPVNFNLSQTDTKDALRIHAVRKLKETKARHICPECNSENTLGIIGTRVATLSSITVGQILASDLDSRTDKFRKVLVFSNSVQDAAHQAGFIEARNYRFTFRSSLQKILNLKNSILSISQLQEAFIDYWKQYEDEPGENMEDAYYYRFFPADCARKANIESDYRLGKKFSPQFKAEFDERMRWEVASEFGYNAILGRTLEKSGASGVRFADETLVTVYNQLKPWLEGNNLGMISELDFIRFAKGVLHRIRTRGGIDHAFLQKYRTGNLELWDLNWMKDNRHFLNKSFHPKARFPKLVTSEPHSRGLLDSTYSLTTNWFHKYFSKSFPLAPDYKPIINDFYRELLDNLEKNGILNVAGNDGNKNYAIRPDAVHVENSVAHYACDTCASVLSVANSDKTLAGTKCLNYLCTGEYQLATKSRPTYYQLVYNRNRSPRIYAAEHTGLLDRKVREIKERDFKTRPKFNSLNVIVATSTLEMGIDIGTLNTAINTAVPPRTSNFLQRVGRAGRSSGSALITNFAQQKAHDLYYYEEPLDMMEGDIQTPGCFLEAKDILFRHFFAYCLDNWALADPKSNSIPGIILLLQLHSADLSANDFFANRIISFIKANEKTLLDRFVDFYAPDLGDSGVLKDLKGYLDEEVFYLRIKRVFEKLKSEFQDIHNKRKEIDRIIKDRNLQKTDAERIDLEADKKALWGLKRLIDKRRLLEHLTNEGLLPNYAFPETGVTLNARVRSEKAKASDSMPSDQQFEIVRSSSSALKELAPDNYFYSQGNRFAISGLNTYDWKDSGVLLKMRFCSNCDHLASSATSTEQTCPKCNDSSWSSAQNHHTFVKLNGVKSINKRERSALDDSSDDRDSNNYRLSRHLYFDNTSFQGAWGMKEIPFGIEYVKNVKLNIVNLGLQKTGHPNKITINQQEDVPIHGFVTCRYCGKSTSNINLPDIDYHYGYCKHKGKDYNNASDDIFEEVFLFREMKTEAIKILLPVQDFDSNVQINMFQAGLNLGLKKFYGGNPDHIDLIEYSEFNPDNNRFDRYLVMYDKIPGGTGYLEKLFDPKNFTDILIKAYQAIRDCTCQHTGKDGCYRCIFTYENQFIQSGLSRTKAESIFKKIVDKSAGWERWNNGIRSITNSGQVEESELEERFIRCIRRFIEKQDSDGFAFESVIQDGVINYKIKLTNGEEHYYYMVRPQYDLGSSESVKYKTRADFYISLTAMESGGHNVDDEKVLASAKNIAVYLDGYAFHAKKESLRFKTDLLRRSSIVDSGNKLTWTLTWADLEKFDAQENLANGGIDNPRKDELAFDRQAFGSTLERLKATPQYREYSSDLINKLNSFERLMWGLMNPTEKSLPSKRIAYMCFLRQKSFGDPSIEEATIDKFLVSRYEAKGRVNQNEETRAGKFYVFPELPDTSIVAKVKCAVKVSDLSMKASTFPLNHTEDIDKLTWEQFWRVYNLVQGDCLIVDSAISLKDDNLLSFDEDKYGCLAYFDEDLHSIVKVLIDNNIPFDEEGSFFLNELDPFPEAALGFRTKKIFIKPQSSEDRAGFINAGYVELHPVDFQINLLV